MRRCRPLPHRDEALKCSAARCGHGTSSILQVHNLLRLTVGKQYTRTTEVARPPCGFHFFRGYNSSSRLEVLGCVDVEASHLQTFDRCERLAQTRSGFRAVRDISTQRTPLSRHQPPTRTEVRPSPGPLAGLSVQPEEPRLRDRQLCGMVSDSRPCHALYGTAEC